MDEQPPQQNNLVELEELARAESGLSASDVKELIKFLVNDTSVPQEMAETDFWAFSDKENALTYFKEPDINIQMKRLELVALVNRMERPAFTVTFSDFKKVLNMEAKVYGKLCRSKDGFERKMQTTQIRQYYTNPNQAKQGGKMFGILGKLFGGGDKAKQQQQY